MSNSISQQPKVAHEAFPLDLITAAMLVSLHKETAAIFRPKLKSRERVSLLTTRSSVH